ncbi:zinc finger protein 90 homolog [Cottoperca gobio]|uniref:Zinc finger protein 90 homolog n=1 Tax=Cottoperca gobio TaxID=56716 RepID=A0A6J2QGY7_COTGO|nr:zinc finger protein 90 homolog [Cottoperca gobio]
MLFGKPEIKLHRIGVLLLIKFFLEELNLYIIRNCSMLACLLFILYHHSSNLFFLFCVPPELPQQHVCEQQEVLTDQQLCIQERNSSLDQEDPEPPQIKEEQEELCTSQEGEQLVLKQETDDFMVTPTTEQSDHSEDQTLYFNPVDTLNASESVGNVQFTSYMVSEQNSDQQLLSHNSHQKDPKVGKHVDSGSNRNAEPNSQNRHHQSNSHINNVHNPTMSKIHHNTQTGKTYFQCDTCGKAFKYQSSLIPHLRTHSGEKPYSCNTCGKRFSQKSSLKTHVRIHTGKKSHTCNTCGKDFRLIRDLAVHMRIHTGEKPFNCVICGKAFRLSGDLTVHMTNIHWREAVTLQDLRDN